MEGAYLVYQEDPKDRLQRIEERAREKEKEEQTKKSTRSILTDLTVSVHTPIPEEIGEEEEHDEILDQYTTTSSSQNNTSSGHSPTLRKNTKSSSQSSKKKMDPTNEFPDHTKTTSSTMWAYSWTSTTNAPQHSRVVASASKLPPHQRPHRRSYKSAEGDDDVSEVTVDTAIRDIRGVVPQDFLDQIAQLKLDLANAKAESDRANWKCQQLEESVDKLQQENKQLKNALKESERKFFVLSVQHASGGGNSGHEDSGCDNSLSTASLTTPHTQPQPYRTIHDDDEDDDPNEDKCGGSTGPPVASAASSLVGDDPSVSTRSHSSVGKGAVAASYLNKRRVVISVESDQGCGQNSGLAPLDEIDLNDSLQKLDTTTLETEATSTTRLPLDDPFSTLEEEEEEPQEEKSRWWWS
mmetsp:Transcript_18787/g.43671  ORF Transcript_18787/g.43671 Transcript_18787/m.43671 type:complete len:410 (+) Transcript_18787:99-1328(+)